jgi:DNA topoisomerase IB
MMQDVRSSINAVLQAEQDLKARHLKTTLDYEREMDSAAQPDLLAES